MILELLHLIHLLGETELSFVQTQLLLHAEVESWVNTSTGEFNASLLTAPSGISRMRIRETLRLIAFSRPGKSDWSALTNTKVLKDKVH